MLKKLIVLSVIVVAVAMATTSTVTVWRSKTDVEAVPLSSIDQCENPVRWSEGINYPSAALMVAGEKQAGVTTYDHQQNGNQGNRVVPYKDTAIHVCWTYSADEVAAHPNRAIYWNVYSTNTNSFFSETGVKASGAYKAGYTTMGLLSDGRAVVAFHQQITSGGDYNSMVAVEAAPGFRVFNTPVPIDETAPLNEYPIWPHIVIGADGTIHVTAHVHSDEAANPEADWRTMYYSRSTDGGQTFSTWIVLTEDGGQDAPMAVSKNGSRVAVAYVDYMHDSLGAGHVWYRESTNGGESWGSPVCITQSRYPADFPMEDTTWRFFAKARDVDIAYDNDNNLHFLIGEGRYLHRVDDKFYIQFAFFSRMFD